MRSKSQVGSSRWATALSFASRPTNTCAGGRGPVRARTMTAAASSGAIAPAAVFSVTVVKRPSRAP